MKGTREELFHYFYTKYNKYVKNLIRQRYPTISQEEREDLEQESLIRIYKHIDTFGERSSLKTWATAVVYNYCKNHFRREYSQKRDVSKNTPIEILINTRYSPKSDNVSFHEFMGDKKTINALDELVMDEVNDLLKSRLEHLDSRFSEPITEVFINEKSCEEAALSLNMNVSTLRSRLCRGKQLLKKIMEKKILQKRKGIGRARSQKASS